MDVIEKDRGITFDVHVVPRSSMSEIVRLHDGALKIRVASPPRGGPANGESIKVLVKTSGVSKTEVEIVSGFTSKAKRARIEGATVAQVAAILKGKS